MIHTIIFIVIGVIVVFGILPTLAMSFAIYYVLLVRNKPEKWGRECSIPDDEEYRNMFDEGMEWDARYSEKKREVDIVSDGYHLYGEYFDFGGTRAVIIIAGRMESLLYSYYFAEPYRQEGLNVLVIDNRAHGKSEGKRNSLGQKEYRDILAWSRLLHDELGNESVVLHGICIGSAAALFALTSEDCPDYIHSMVAEGMYTTFYETFKNHMIQDKHPLFPFALEVMLHIRIFSGVNVLTDGPIRRIGKLDRPILFLHSKEDTFSLPEKAEELYEKCSSNKKIVGYNKGAHSRIRANNKQAYDDAIVAFLRKNA